LTAANATCERRAGTLTIFCVDLLHHLNLEVTLGDQLLQPRILCLELLQPAHIIRLHGAETLAPRVDRLLGNAVLLGDARLGVPIRFAQDRNHLLVREPRLAHAVLRFGGQSLK
jgi:hypothetical protein